MNLSPLLQKNFNLQSGQVVNGALPQPPIKETAGPAGGQAGDRKLRQACADFEALVLNQMLAAMRKTIPKSGLVDGGHAADLYQSMHDEALTTSLAQEEGMGFGEVLYRQLSGQVRPTTHER